MQVPTIKVTCKESGTAMVINETDFDAARHEKLGTKKAAEKTEKKAGDEVEKKDEKKPEPEKK